MKYSLLLLSAAIIILLLAIDQYSEPPSLQPCFESSTHITDSQSRCKCIPALDANLRYLSNQFFTRLAEFQNLPASLKRTNKNELNQQTRLILENIEELKRLRYFHIRRFHDTSAAAIAATPASSH